MRFDTHPTGMKNNKNTVTVVESVSNDGACCVDSTTISGATLENGRHVDMTSTTEDSRCTVNRTTRNAVEQKFLSSIVESGVIGIQLSGNGLIVTKEDISSDEYNCVFRTVLSINKSSCWLLGDILLLGDRCWGNRYTESKYDEAMAATGLSRSTLRGIVTTCRKFPVDKRHAGLSFTHHQEIARTDASPVQRDEVLQQAANDKLSCSALRKQLKQTRFVEDEEPEGNSRPPQGEEPDRLGLLDLPERVAPDAPPMWDAMKFKQWVNKQDPEEYSAEQCAQAIKLTEDIADFYQQVLARLEELQNSENTV